MARIYGISIHDADGKRKVITADDATVIAAGSVTMSNSLEADDTYGEDVSLGATYSGSEISVLVVPRRPVFGTVYTRFVDTTLYYNTVYLDSTKTYYTRSPSTGVMTSFSAGARTNDNKSTWNPVLSVFPTAFWDKMGATTFSSVRLFAATAYCMRDTHNDTDFSLAGTASGSGTGDRYGGSPSNINDDDDSTSYSNGCYRNGANPASCAWNTTAQVTFASKTVNRAWILHWPFSVLQAGADYANGWLSVELYYASAWHAIFSASWSGNYDPGIINSWASGHWKGCTGIRYVVSGNARTNGSFKLAQSEYGCYGLYAMGPGTSDDDENKIVYSVGNQGITTVDYMVCRTKFIG